MRIVPRKPPPHIQAVLDAIAREGGPPASIEDLNAALARHLGEYNTRPQAELGGLSPDQMQQLLAGDWVTSGALRIRQDLTIDDMSAADFFADARSVMAYLREHGPVKPTARGNLPRTMVVALLPTLRTYAALQAEFTTEIRVRNEDDLKWLPVLRHVLQFAGLLVRRNGFRLTRRGSELLDDSRAGELYAVLFQTLMQKLDLRALGTYDDHAGLQATLAYSLWRLPSCCADWTTPEQISNAAWLESAKDPLGPHDVALDGDYRFWTFENRVLDPLVKFALVEMRTLPAEHTWPRKREYRVTPLYARFIRVEL